MKIGVLGTGNVGRTLGLRAAQAGHDVAFGSRDPASAKCAELAAEGGGTVKICAGREAANGAELLLLAVPWAAAQATLEACGDLSHCVLVDCINPLRPDLSGLDLVDVDSASQQIARWVPSARVVKAFNTVSAATMADPDYGGQPATLFYCGDAEEDKRPVGQLGGELGFEAVDAGPLRHAAHLESLAMLYIHLAINGWGSNCAFKVLRR